MRFPRLKVVPFALARAIFAKLRIKVKKQGKFLFRQNNISAIQCGAGFIFAAASAKICSVHRPTTKIEFISLFRALYSSHKALYYIVIGQWTGTKLK